MLLPLSLVAQNPFFEKNWGSSFADIARSVKQSSDGTIFVFGYSSGGLYGGADFALSRLDESGNLIWMKHFGDTLDNYGMNMLLTRDGNVVFCGESAGPSGLDILVCKSDTSGNILWKKVISTPVNESARYIEQVKDGGYILTGFQSDSSGSNNVYVLKLDSAGNKLWEKSFGGSENDYGNMVHQTADGGFFVSGDTKSFGFGLYDTYLLKLDLSGNLIWQKTFGDKFSNGNQGFLLTRNGNLLMYGESNIDSISPFDGTIQMIDTGGNPIWLTHSGSPFYTDALFSATETSDGGFVLCGYSSSYNNGGPSDVVLVKTDSAGTILWTRTYGEKDIDIGYDIQISRSGGFLAAGRITAEGVVQKYLLHTDASGLTSSRSFDWKSTKNPTSIFPNPGSGDFQIRSSLQGFIVELFSSDGKKLFSSSSPDGSMNVNLGDRIDPGFYILTIAGNEETHTLKVIITR